MNRVLFSSASDDWSTPKEVFEALNQEFDFDDDPCPLGATNGLTRAWGTRVFVNPPYSNIRGFLEKAMLELNLQTSLVVFLVPSRTDTKWWHEIVIPHATDIRFIKGRLKFGNSKNSAPFPSCVIILKSKLRPSLV